MRTQIVLRFGVVTAVIIAVFYPCLIVAQAVDSSPVIDASSAFVDRLLNNLVVRIGLAVTVITSIITLLSKMRELAREARRSKEILTAILRKLRETPSPTKVRFKDDVFKAQLGQNRNIATEVGVGAKLIVVASGKGGVGKSTVALGLMEAFCRFDKTLLVDFDMHNRGLTSLLSSQKASPAGDSSTNTTVLDELVRFSGLFGKSVLNPDNANRSRNTENLSEDERFDLFKELRHEFSSADGFSLPIGALQFSGSESIRISGEPNPILPEHAFFLPSMERKDLFLSSSVFRATWVEVFYFLKCLSYWAGTGKNGFNRIILDCHGAHDLFMVGAIHAASALILVSTPEPGSFDGTFDLLTFSAVLKKELPMSEFTTVLTLNNCENWQTKATGEIKAFVKKSDGLKTAGVVEISATDEIRRVTNHYEIGSVSKRAPLWNGVKSIRNFIVRGTGSGVAPSVGSAVADPQTVEEPDRAGSTGG